MSSHLTDTVIRLLGVSACVLTFCTVNIIPTQAADSTPPPPSSTPAPAGPMTIQQTLSDEGQRNTIAFSALSFISGSLGADSFFPPGKVADFWGFQYMRDNDLSQKGHNTDFLTKAANNMLSVLNDNQRAQLIALAKEQVTSINDYAYKRFPLMNAFRQQLEGDLPAGSTGLDETAVKNYSAQLYHLDGEISLQRAQVMGSILAALNPTQRAYLDALKGKGMMDWPIVGDQIDPTTLDHDVHVAVMTYAGDLFSWYLGSIEADVYFAPERQGTYFGSFYMKDAPAMGNADYTIDSTLTGNTGQTLLNLLTAEQAQLLNSLVDSQRTVLQEIVATRQAVATQLRRFMIGETADSATILNLMDHYGELDGEIIYQYATHFAQLGQSLTHDQQTQLMDLRVKILGNFSGPPSGAFLYSNPIAMPAIPNTDFLFTTTNMGTATTETTSTSATTSTGTTTVTPPATTTETTPLPVPETGTTPTTVPPSTDTGTSLETGTTGTSTTPSTGTIPTISPVPTTDTTSPPSTTPSSNTTTPPVTETGTTPTTVPPTTGTDISPITPVTPVTTTPVPPVATTVADCNNLSAVGITCNANGKIIMVTEIQPTGLLANGVLNSTLINQGWVSNITLTTNGQLVGGVVTGYIKNQGIMLDFEFKGKSIIGGTLGGIITNTSRIGGYFQDVTLQANTKIIGGTLKGTIKGDEQSPALLENVTVKAGSHLIGVKLGTGVKLGKGVIVESLEEKPTTPGVTLPTLGQATATDAKGQTVMTKTAITGGLSLNGKGFSLSGEAKQLSDNVELKGHLQIDPAHVKQKVSIFVKVQYQATKDSQEKYYFKLDAKGGLLPWTEGDLVSLGEDAFQSDVILPETYDVTMYHGILLATGVVQVKFGYRLEDGTVVQSPQAVELTVNE